MRKADSLQSLQPPSSPKGYLRLHLNENLHAPPQEVLKQLRNFDASVLNNYPAYEELIDAISSYAEVPKNQICISNGSEQAIDIVFRALFQKGDRVVVPSPTFYPFYHFLASENIKISPAYYRYNQKLRSWDFPVEETLRGLNTAEGLVLVNPANPLGLAIPENQLSALIRKAVKENIFVIVDEAYYEFCGKTVKGTLAKYKNVVILRTFSKYFGLSGVRLGYIMANKNLTARFHMLRPIWNVNSFAVFAGLICFQHINTFERLKNETIRARENLFRFFREQNTETWNSDTNFLTIIDPDIPKRMKDFKKNHILVSELAHYPYSANLLKNAIRVTVPIRQDLIRFKKVYSDAARKSKR